MPFDWTHGPLAEGLRHYNTGHFFEAHEFWESVWLVTPQAEKRFLQGLIQVTVAMHHFARGNHLGATRLFTAALAKLSPHAPTFCGIAVVPLCDDIRACLASLAADPPPTHLTPPRITPQLP